MELDLQSLFWLHPCVQLYLLAEPQQLFPSPRIWAHIQRRYWSAKIGIRHLFVTPWKALITEAEGSRELVHHSVLPCLAGGEWLRAGIICTWMDGSYCLP
jgi:hypothetical protein